MRSGKYRFIASVVVFFGLVNSCYAQKISVAVSSNALAALKVISAEFEKKTGHVVQISSGSTGKLYSQIVNGAPYDIFLAANEREPRKLENSHIAAPNSRFTYAIGKLVAWSSDKSLEHVKDINEVLVSKSVVRIAIANPKTAPYGFAAQQVLHKLGVWKQLQSKIVHGDNVSQTYQFAMTNNAQVGFVAKSQILSNINPSKGSFWEVPVELYEPIRQQAVMLSRTTHKALANEFIKFLKSDRVKAILTTQFGYGAEPTGASS
jgi:molybdate transport system substrate-binding protein